MTLLKRNILIRDCIYFSEIGDHYFRVVVRTETENTKLLQNLSEMIPTPHAAC